MSKTVNIDYIIQIWKENEQSVAHAMPLDIMSAGSTPQEARQALEEAIRLFIVTAADMGTLEEVLEEAGYGLSEGKWVSPPWVAIGRHSTAVGL